MLSYDDIAAHFTRDDGTFHFARWRRPIAPVVFGAAEEMLPVIKGAMEAVAVIAGHQMAETDPEMGANLMWFFVPEWAALRDVPDLARMIPDLAPLLDRLEAANANQYRAFRFEEDGAIRAGFSFVRLDAAMQLTPADALALSQAVQMALLWSERAFSERPMLLSGEDGQIMVRPEICALLSAAYAPAIPAAATDPALAYRLAARVGQGA